MKTVGYAAHAADAKLVPYHFERRDLRENDVAIEILYCGVCHSDLHTVNGDWGPQPYPLIPGHEIVGVVTSVGQNVKNFIQAIMLPLAAWWIVVCTAISVSMAKSNSVVTG